MISFSPHPAVVRGLFFWDFCLDFALATEEVLREGVRTYDMTNFKGQGSLPKCSAPQGIGAVIGALDCLAKAVQTANKPFLSTMLIDLRPFLLRVRSDD
ncbi:hypothetical protein JG687_00006264 [Phytophthora cactorum]|uniref:Uncharacterized protein n=1 Tax=Phytophthora cactorum TaxID=29920 RepID=A0A8T1UNE9_9STRA|nr:hypothetical protein PC120_g7693 [Phytophthora cactorum]KAG4055455.1 hypothetical protein PC123_g9459 [Phytophthora cactorum]KAG6963956.1 hypothetical protein JG687_00006264 [Phytophthora cactorum]